MTQSLSGQKKEKKVNVCVFFSSSLNTKNMGPPLELRESFVAQTLHGGQVT